MMSVMLSRGALPSGLRPRSASRHSLRLLRCYRELTGGCSRRAALQLACGTGGSNNKRQQQWEARRPSTVEKSPEEGASTSIYAAVSPELEGVGGCYLCNEQRTKSVDVSYDEELQKRLWTESCKLVGIPDTTP